MKNVIKPQSYSVDAFEFLEYIFRVCGKFLLGTWEWRRWDVIFLSVAIKLSYLYHSNLRAWTVLSCTSTSQQRGCECKIMVCPQNFFAPRSSRPVRQFDFVSHLFRSCELRKELNKENFDKLLHIFSLCIFAVASLAWLGLAWPGLQIGKRRAQKITSICQATQLS